MIANCLKKIIKFLTNPEARFAYLNSLGFTRWIPDSSFIKIEYKLVTGKKLDLKNPKTYNEKLQWLKLYNRKPEYTTMVDKYEAKKYVASIIGEEYIIPTIGVWDRFEDIDFDKLPEEFVLKCTHDSGGLVICNQDKIFDKELARKKINNCLKKNYYNAHREWPYKNVTPRVIAEAYMEDDNHADGLRDYKFFCFNNEPKFLYVSEGLDNHETARISFYDFEGNQMPFSRSDYAPMPPKIELPKKVEEMKSIAKTIADEIDSPFIRVDLYSIYEKIYFSEITFFPCSGFLPFKPEHWDKTLGDWIKLPCLSEK